MICDLDECKVEFQPKNKVHRYCTQEHRNLAIKLRVQYTSLCKRCGIEFKHSDYRNQYCSHSCSAKSSNESRIRMGKCKTCSIEIRAKFKYCDDCNPRLYVDRWVVGKESGSNINGILKVGCRNYLLELAGHQCIKCGWGIPNPVTGKPILTINHIDGNWKNNRVDNLEVLCYNCHTLTENFGSLNMGNGAGIRGSGNRAYNGAIE